MTVVFEADGVRAEVDPDNGARLISLRFGGHEVLATGHTAAGERIGDGCFPMAPWAGRVGGGRIEYDGVTAMLPVREDGNAIHGLVRSIPWAQADSSSFVCNVDAPWPVPGTVRLRYTATPGSLAVELSWEGGGDFPFSLGLHPWFLKTLATGETLQPDLDLVEMFQRGPDHLPTGRLVPVSPGPWDDCFRMGRSPVLHWADALSLRLESTSPWWVVYDEPAYSTCVEPQTAPPDAFARESLRPEGDWPRTLILTMTAIDAKQISR